MNHPHADAAFYNICLDLVPDVAVNVDREEKYNHIVGITSRFQALNLLGKLNVVIPKHVMIMVMKYVNLPPKPDAVPLLKNVQYGSSPHRELARFGDRRVVQIDTRTHHFLTKVARSGGFYDLCMWYVKDHNPIVLVVMAGGSICVINKDYRHSRFVHPKKLGSVFRALCRDILWSLRIRHMCHGFACTTAETWYNYQELRHSDACVGMPYNTPQFNSGVGPVCTKCYMLAVQNINTFLTNELFFD